VTVPGIATENLLRHARELVSLGHSEEILGAACRELRAITHSELVYATFCPTSENWMHTLAIEHFGEGTRRAAPEARSALFAVHRHLALRRVAVELRHDDETRAIFKGLRCPEEIEVVHAIPVIHRTGRLWGELVFAGTPSLAWLDAAIALAQLTTVALENSQRLAFARRDQDRLLLIAEATSDALYDWNFDTREFWWGGGILKMLGRMSDPVETTSRWRLERIHPDDRVEVIAGLERARFGTDQAWSWEYRFRRGDGTYIDVEDRGSFLREVDGRAYRMVGSMRDVTSIKALLTREQQARREAESASRAKDEFLAMLGHELRNPLAPIITGMHLLRMKDKRLSKELDVIERQAKHLVRLVDDLLDISRIAHGKIELKKERLDIATVIAAAIETTRPLIDTRRHTLDLDHPAGYVVDADRARLVQVISNLLANAAKYSEPGGRITVRAQRVEGTIEVAVRDTGIGISPDMLPNIFSMFVQEKQALDRAQGGLGLGLAIVRSMVVLHGGTVSANSEGLGCGSEFVIRLPEAELSSLPIETDPALEKMTRAGRRILIVDDNTDAAELLAVLLERLGNTTRVAYDAMSALRMLDDFEPELAVLDIGLPEIDGYELARRLRARVAGARLIALSGYGQQADRDRSASAGFDAHLVKPVAVATLKSVISNLEPR
jgi:PAS domain S-box-containing protein